MKCSFIVSAFDRPDALSCMLYSLKIQTERDFEVLVMDNSHGVANLNAVLDLRARDMRFRHVTAHAADCYDSANLGATMAQGDYLCFPSDDGYYVPQFLELMLKPAVDLMYCDMVYDPRGGAYYRTIAVQPQVGLIDKGGFLLRRERFCGFDGPLKQDRPADGWLAERVVREGAAHAKVPGVLWFHN